MLPLPPCGIAGYRDAFGMELEWAGHPQTRGGVNIGRVRLRGGVHEIDDLAGVRTVDGVSGNRDPVGGFPTVLHDYLNELRRYEIRARSDRAVSHPNPDAMEMRWKIPPLPKKRDTPPNARPISTKLPTIEKTRYRGVARPAVFPAPCSGDCADQAGQGYSSEDRDRADVVQRAFTG
jgi:hypothetical protein